MSDRTPIIAGNWKMYKTMAESAAYVDEFLGLVADASGVEIVLCPSFTSLAEVRRLTSASNVRVAAQNMHFEAEGAYTGEISPAMLKEIGIDDVVLGHSERREYYNENDGDLARKVAVALENGFRPILCCGETDEERDAGNTEAKLEGQLINGLAGIDVAQIPSIVVAYEPIWAIGTGKTATPQMAQETSSFIRGILTRRFGDGAQQVRILYGGSVKPGNIDELMAEQDIDGALVGGASLAAADFARIVNFQ
ncbi:MAG: triose-phosphate isomerase [Actinobacteria bacterium]|nr:triose-phosphate isomerase [Actinomycetota bacterium]MCL5883105.1 triose-phosphate isomerase [Actinomycetota bacterium]